MQDSGDTQLVELDALSGRTCPYCGCPIGYMRADAIFCGSKECRNSYSREKYRAKRSYVGRCRSCGEEFTMLHAGRRDFCSVKCSNDWHHKNQRAARNVDRGLAHCPVCHGRFDPGNRSVARQYCSPSCSSRSASMRRSYGVDPSDIWEMYEAQSHKCALCDSPIEINTGNAGTSAHIDHCHEQGHVRGLLCPQCNTGLGLFRDDPYLLSKASAYVVKHTNHPPRGLREQAPTMVDKDAAGGGSPIDVALVGGSPCNRSVPTKQEGDPR